MPHVLNWWIQNNIEP